MKVFCMQFVTAGTLAALICLPAQAQPPAKKIADALQPFVENHTIAGAVTLVADKDKVLSLDTVGYADLAAKKADAAGQPLLDRLDDQAGDGNGRADAPGRGQALRGRSGGEVPAGTGQSQDA